MTKNNNSPYHFMQRFCAVCVLLTVLLLSGCKSDDPEPLNEEEVITTVLVTLTPDGGGIPVLLSFFDADGERGSTEPIIQVSGPLKSSTRYLAAIELKNETVNPPGNISKQVEEQAADHLFCFDVNGNVSIQYEDEDANGLPLGLATSWETAVAGTADVTISLRHQAGTKTGDCPGSGDTDAEVTFSIVME